MKRLLIIGFAACAFALAPALSVSAMPSANPSALIDTDSSIVLVKGGHGHGGGHGWGRRGGRGHHYGWGRGHRGHHYGWSRGRHRGWR